MDGLIMWGLKTYNVGKTMPSTAKTWHSSGTDLTETRIFTFMFTRDNQTTNASLFARARANRLMSVRERACICSCMGRFAPELSEVYTMIIMTRSTLMIMMII